MAERKHRYRLKIYCECGRRIAVTSDQPHEDQDGKYWTLRYHRRPDGEICGHRTVRSEVRVISCDDLSPEFRERIAADARDLVERMKAEGWSTVVDADGTTRWQRPEGAPPAHTIEEWAEIRRASP